MRFWRNNGLSLTLTALFLLFWGAQAYFGWHAHNEEEAREDGTTLSFKEYLRNGHFWQATGENWESEFLQMGCYVLLTCWLFQKGSAESKDPDEPADHDKPKPGTFWKRNSLTFAFLALFLLSFAMHAKGGLAESNEERAKADMPPESMGEFLTGPEFWFQSFQNWQSEFLAVLSIVVLSIFLRQHGSPESKEVNDPNSKTGT